MITMVDHGSFFGRDNPTAEVSEEVNRKLPARNTTVRLLTLYTDPKRHNAQR